jgi:exopolyphosphatase / guanosine-5'-triphosphate,3'-diphosphate pyrophosphatase
MVRAMPTLAALDIGSNAIRLVVGDVDPSQHITVVENLRESIRLGRDAFAGGLITEETIDRATEAFRRFHDIIERHTVRWTRAVATSALREALNAEIVLDRVQQATGIDIEVIGGEEEACLIHLAVSERVNLKNRIALLVDIGGGSTEITLVAEGSIMSTESYKMGTVRLLQLLGDQQSGERDLVQLIQEYVDATQRRIRREIGNRKIDLCVGTGGNIESLGDLRREILGKTSGETLPTDDLKHIVDRLKGLTYADRVQQLRLRPDRADVILPASIIIQKILHVANVDELVIPRVGLKDGLLMDMVQELYGERKTVRRDQVIASTMEIGRKYQFDEQHATVVARFAVALFDRTHDLHHLGIEYRLVLEVAALLHDVGTFISAADHHKHSHYLITSSPVIGFNRPQQTLVAAIARYHRKSMPKPQHEEYRALSSKERVVVSKLASILRLADALDNEHGAKVIDFEVKYRKPRLTMQLHGHGDLLLEKWALMKKAPMFEEVFSVTFAIES